MAVVFTAPMGFLDRLKGTSKPDPGVAPVPPEQLYHMLLGLNRPTAPWGVRSGAPEGVDLVAEWKIVDASWYEIFAKAHLERAYKVLMRFDPPTTTVRATDQEWMVEWEAGVPQLSLQASGFRGQKTEVSFGTAYAFTETGQYGEVYNYRFNSSELKTPLKATINGAGWTYQAVAFGKL
ncbi:hypothetical protein [Mycobacterium hubeiense]|uniref:hypothetical protein n=1 Tax=Mycobacterium hubeiense TaxID=1867256 RepID=UPI001E3156AC|nr:hypothetical protein [Mycobacterium sp. QGD 101]